MFLRSNTFYFQDRKTVINEKKEIAARLKKVYPDRTSIHESQKRELDAMETFVNKSLFIHVETNIQ